MQAILPVVADLWWIAPSAVGVGAVSYIGLRRSRRSRARYLGLDAARHDLRAAETRLRDARNESKSAKGHLTVTKSERQSGTATNADVQAARDRVWRARRELQAASAAVRGRREQVTAARDAMHASRRDEAMLPLAQVMDAHDRILGRWLDYETDVDKRLAFPSMSDGRSPATAEFLAALERTRNLRPSSRAEAMTPQEFSEYRAAVVRLESAFLAAERAAGVGGRAERAEPTETLWGIELPDAVQGWVRSIRSFIPPSLLDDGNRSSRDEDSR